MGNFISAIFDYLGNLQTSAMQRATSATPGDTNVHITTKVVPIKAMAITAGTPVLIWTPASGKKFRVLGYSLGVSVASAIMFEDASGSGNEFMRAQATPTVGAGSVDGFGNGYVSSAANNGLYFDATVSTTVNGFVCGDEE